MTGNTRLEHVLTVAASLTENDLDRLRAEWMNSADSFDAVGAEWPIPLRHRGVFCAQVRGIQNGHLACDVVGGW